MKYRRATFDDIEAVYNIINDYAATGVMLARSRNALYEAVRDMIVAEEDGEVVGVGCLHFIWDRLAEVRSMAIKPEFARHGIGAEIVRRLIEDGEKYGMKKVFTLTYKPEFFETLGFFRVTKDELPHKVWKDCIDCPKFPNCDEIAMEMII